MVLTVAMAVDMGDAYSVEAPGAQVQAVGSYKAVLFAGLPGQENDFTIRIGTDSFETTGIMMAMVPGTLEQLSDIKELRENKDTVDNSVTAVYDSFNEILNILQSTSDGLGEAKAGLSGLEDARATISASMDGVYADADRSLADMTGIIRQMGTLIPHLQNGQQLVQDVNAHINGMVATMNGVTPYLDSLTTSVHRIQNDTEKLQDVLDDVQDNTSDRDRLMDDIEDNIHTVESDLRSMGYLSDEMEDALDDLSDDLSGLQGMLSSLPPSPTEPLLGNVLGASAPMVGDLKDMIDATNLLVGALGEIAGNSGDFTDMAQDTVDLANAYFDSLDKGLDVTGDLLGELNTVGDTADGLLQSGTDLIGEASALNDTMNQYKDDTVAALGDSAELLRQMTAGLTDAQAFLSSAEATLKASDDSLDDGTRQALGGLIDLLQKSLDGLGTTATLRSANDAIKNAYDEEMDKLDDDSNILNMDPEADPISFTSDKNPSPESVQIILRTQEISIENSENNADLEQSREDAGVLARIADLFAEIWHKLTVLFS